MAPLLLKQLAVSVTRHLVQMSRLSPAFRSAAVPCRTLGVLSSAPRPLLLPAAGASAPAPSSLRAQCEHLSCVQPAVGMKTKSALRKRCKDCFFVRRRGRLFVFCKAHPRHKQRQG